MGPCLFNAMLVPALENQKVKRVNSLWASGLLTNHCPSKKWHSRTAALILQVDMCSVRKPEPSTSSLGTQNKIRAQHGHPVDTHIREGAPVEMKLVPQQTDTADMPGAFPCATCIPCEQGELSPCKTHSKLSLHMPVKQSGFDQSPKRLRHYHVLCR